MKPILLYNENETSFTSNGIGSLNEAISAVVIEERNGIYELTLTYPISGKHYADIKYSRIIKCATIPNGDYQLFRIYSISKEINGIVTISAEHISYQLAYIAVDGFNATTAAEALYKMGANAMSTCPFTFWTDKETTANYKCAIPDNIRARLGGTKGSVLDVYGGEYEWDNYVVKLHNHRGTDRNVTLRYGKNITDIKQEENISNVYTSIVGYYEDEETVVKTGVIDSEYASAYPFKRVKVVNFSSDYETPPTVQQLATRATSYMNSNSFGIPHINVKVSFVALWQTEEYKDVAPLERVYLCDTVSVYFEKLGITTSAKVVKTQYNVLLDRYDSIELGEARTNLSARLANQENETEIQLADTRSSLEKAINHATELIRGGLGGYVVMGADNNGYPQEILIMDDPDIEQAEHIWRWNMGGLGYSSDYGEHYETAINMDGSIVANFITTGTLSANRVRAGLLEDNAGNNYWNLTTGEFKLTSGVKIGNKTFQDYVDDLQDQIDGNVTTWFYGYAPTTSNAPASTWTTVNEKIAHIGDLFYDSETGYCYRWQVKENAVDPAHPTANEFEWVQISDEDIAAAMAAASNAQDTADHKRRIFTTQPTPPYDVGDTWMVGTTGDILTCMTPKSAGQSYSASDFQKRNKYTDDSYVQTWIANTYSVDKTNIEGQIDKKAETWYQSADPSTAWLNPDTRDDHVGDLWYKTANGENTTWFYQKSGNTYSWVQQNVPKAVFDTIDGKAQIFISQPTPPYYQGDLWFNSTSSDIMTCITTRTTGGYTATDWQKRNKYVDSATASAAGAAAAGDAITAYDATLTQQEIFDRLTDDGEVEGIYMEDGQLYINASYIATGVLSDPDQNTVWDLSTGALSCKKLSVSSPNFTLTEAGIITATGVSLSGEFNTTYQVNSSLIRSVAVNEGKLTLGQDHYSNGVVDKSWTSEIKFINQGINISPPYNSIGGTYGDILIGYFGSSANGGDITLIGGTGTNKGVSLSGDTISFGANNYKFTINGVSYKLQKDTSTNYAVFVRA